LKALESLERETKFYEGYSRNRQNLPVLTNVFLSIMLHLYLFLKNNNELLLIKPRRLKVDHTFKLRQPLFAIFSFLRLVSTAFEPIKFLKKG
jgi:hypothetical protein